jgi:xylulokinase
VKIVCGIDLGTQSCKIVLYDYEKGRVLGLAQAALDIYARNDGTREQETLWYEQALINCFASLDPELKSSIEAVGVSGQQHGFVPLDGEGRTIRPVKLWCDTSTAAECQELTLRSGGEAAVLAKTGMLFLPGYTAPKILWLKKHEPEAFRRLAHVLLPHDYINFLLTGNIATEYGDASGTALLDIRSRSWSEDIANLIDDNLYGCLPPLLKAWEPHGKVSGKAARTYGIPEGAIVSSGGGDNMMGAIGTGSVKDGFLTMSLGTSGTLYGFSKSPVVDPHGNLAAFCSSSDGWLPLLCTMNCTVASEIIRNLLELDIVQFNAFAARAAIGADGLAVLPFFNGERIPNLPEGRASIQGGTAANFTRENIARAAMESAIFGMKLGLDAFKTLGFDAKEIRLIGGGAKSPLWRSMAANLMMVPVRIPAEKESAALGAAIQALYCLGKNTGDPSSLETLVDRHVRIDYEATVEPDPSTFDQWKSAYASYEKYLKALMPLYR